MGVVIRFVYGHPYHKNQGRKEIKKFIIKIIIIKLIKKFLIMKGIFWNGNGFADSKKYKFLSDLTNEKN